MKRFTQDDIKKIETLGSLRAKGVLKKDANSMTARDINILERDIRRINEKAAKDQYVSEGAIPLLIEDVKKYNHFSFKNRAHSQSTEMSYGEMSSMDHIVNKVVETPALTEDEWAEYKFLMEFLKRFPTCLMYDRKDIISSPHVDHVAHAMTPEQYIDLKKQVKERY